LRLTASRWVKGDCEIIYVSVDRGFDVLQAVAPNGSDDFVFAVGILTNSKWPSWPMTAVWLSQMRSAEMVTRI